MNRYPVHRPVQIPGQGTEANPYLISNDNAFVVLRNTKESPSEHYRLVENIDLAGFQWFDAVFPSFSGTFDGDGFAISNLTISGEDNLGLFGSQPRLSRWLEMRSFARPGAVLLGTGHGRAVDPEGRQGDWYVWSAVFQQFAGQMVHRLDGGNVYGVMGYDLSVRRRWRLEPHRRNAATSRR